MDYKLFTSLAAWLCLAAHGSHTAIVERRPITVEDAISMTRLADPSYFLGGSYEVAQFSPDGSRFVIVLRNGDLATNSNTYTMYLFQTKSALNSPKPEIVTRMTSSSNVPGIRSVIWLADNRHIAFLGVKGDAGAQVFLVDVDSHRLHQKTHHRTEIQLFSISGNGKELAFAAAPLEGEQVATESGTPRIVTSRSLSDMLFGNQKQRDYGFDLYVAGKSEKKISLPSTNRLGLQNAISVSPDGKAAIVTADYRSIPTSWQAYKDDRIRALLQQHVQSNASTGVHQMFLIDITSGNVSPVADAPAPFPAQIHWAQDARSVYLKTYLPLESDPQRPCPSACATDVVQLQLRLTGRQIRRMTAQEWDQELPKRSSLPLAITLEEDPNTPAKIFASLPSEDKKVMLFDLNPQFSQLEFGKVDQITFSVQGINVIAGLYYPPHYVPGVRYPLIIQTHGFDRKRFSMDGSNEWSSAFAARPLAAKGFLVLQMLEYESEADHEKARMAPSLGANKLQRAKELVKLSYEAAVDALDRRGIIDRDQVGITGFSRTVMFTAYALTHSAYVFKAGVLTDGIDAGWYQYLTYGVQEIVEDNGGESPFTKDGLTTWINESPSFSMDRVSTPMRIVALSESNLLEMWEWYAALRAQNKPVELVELPEAVHLLERPKDRLASMQGIVDWFQFWMQGVEDPDPSKHAQYERWQVLRSQQVVRQPAP